MKRKNLTVLCMAAAFSAGAALTSFAATGWVQEDGTWRYYNASGDRASDTFKKSGNHMFFLDDDGNMVVNSLVEYDDNYYYVNEDGAMVKNEWRLLDNEDPDDEEPDMVWYYFQNTGKAAKASSSGNVKFHSIRIASGETKKYAFAENGKMMTGWLDESGTRVTGEDAWMSGLYYAGDDSDGAIATGAWRELEAEGDDIEDDDFNGMHWFYFGTNGKKIVDAKKTINGRKYRFDEYGATEFKWYETASGSSATSSNIYYNEVDQRWQASGWFYVVPSESIDAEAYENDDAYWFYAKNDGSLYTSQIKKVNGYDYAFNDKGEMLQGLYKLTFDGKTITSAEEIETEADMPGADDEADVYYFGTSPKDGVMKTGTATIEIDGEKYSYEFKKSGGTLKGSGYNGFNDGSIFIKGRKLKADSDTKLEVVEYNGEEYLINTSGKIQKKKTNVKDADGVYYSTDASGIVTYRGNEKQPKE